jgi:hypothetical protein
MEFYLFNPLEIFDYESVDDSFDYVTDEDGRIAKFLSLQAVSRKFLDLFPLARDFNPTNVAFSVE